MSYKRKCKICDSDYGNGVIMIKLTSSWVCVECFGEIIRKRYV